MPERQYRTALYDTGGCVVVSECVRTSAVVEDVAVELPSRVGVDDDERDLTRRRHGREGELRDDRPRPLRGLRPTAASRELAEAERVGCRPVQLDDLAHECCPTGHGVR